MNHSDMPHDHMMMDQQTLSAPPQTHALDLHHPHLNTSFWTLSNSIELVLIVLFIVFFILKRQKWQQHPFTLSLTALLFLISMHPLTDSIARHSVWLHCLQSSLIHHLIPFALLVTLPPNVTTYPSQPSATTARLLIFSIVAFNLMSFMWILPALHLRLMQDALLYSAMKWGMALTGILLCQTMQAFNHYKNIAGLNYQNFNLLMLVPQALIGLTLMLLPPLYAMPEALMHHEHMQMFAQLMPQLSEQHDQLVGGLILSMASFLFLLMDLKRRHTFFQFRSSSSLDKEVA